VIRQALRESCRRRLDAASREDGSSIIEVVIASALMVTLMAGLMSLAAMALSTTENQGHLSARTTEYAQDKMEQLLALAWSDGDLGGLTGSDTTSFPAATSGGTGLAVGGSYNTSAPVAKYVDYLDQSGNLLVAVGTTAPTGWFYERVWKVENPSTNLKKITVTATIARGFGGAAKASSTLIVLKTFPF
jgi:hypothetical protein